MKVNAGGQLISGMPVEPDSVKMSFLAKGSDQKCLKREAVKSCAGFPLRRKLHKQIINYMQSFLFLWAIMKLIKNYLSFSWIISGLCIHSRELWNSQHAEINVILWQLKTSYGSVGSTTVCAGMSN